MLRGQEIGSTTSIRLPQALRRGRIPIAPAAPPVPHFPRFRALALFGRRPQERVDRLVNPASENLRKTGHCRHSPGRYGIAGRRCRHHSDLMLADRITLAHFSVYAVMNVPKSEGEPTNTVPARSPIRALIRSSERPALI